MRKTCSSHPTVIAFMVFMVSNYDQNIYMLLTDHNAHYLLCGAVGPNRPQRLNDLNIRLCANIANITTTFKCLHCPYVRMSYSCLIDFIEHITKTPTNYTNYQTTT